MFKEVIPVLNKPTYTERDGCIYVDFGQTSEGTAARTVSLPEADMLIADYMKNGYPS